MHIIVGVSYNAKIREAHNRILLEISKLNFKVIVIKRDHNYSRALTLGFKSRNRFPVTINEGLRRN